MTERELAQIAEASMIERMWDAERSMKAWRLAALVASGVSVTLALIMVF